MGFSEERIVLVFFLVSFLGSGMSLSFTYGSDSPLGSIGIRFLASPTAKGKGKHETSNEHRLQVYFTPGDPELHLTLAQFIESAIIKAFKLHFRSRKF